MWKLNQNWPTTIAFTLNRTVVKHKTDVEDLEAMLHLEHMQIIILTNCPSDFPKDNLQILGDAVNEYCKLGCESSVCGALTTLQNSGASEIMSGAVEQCTKSCSVLCSKGSIQPALES
ncbi:putative thionin-2.4 [Cardamine amara subsp. amara]|uniref:Thionin-2.4 n=1 Tax=Cardamine amara subsp. amara TaxID=228776 RepID=A0ABD1A2D4_CARAN